jgi:hypothetical protein
LDAVIGEVTANAELLALNAVDDVLLTLAWKGVFPLETCAPAKNYSLRKFSHMSHFRFPPPPPKMTAPTNYKVNAARPVHWLGRR